MDGLRIEAYGPEPAQELAATVHALYAAEYPQAPAFAEWRDGLWARHRARSGFDLLVAWDGDRPVGLVWGYLGDRGQFWSDAVAAALPDRTADAWIGGHQEVVELIVAPTHRGRGLGSTLLTTLVARSTSDRAMLSVRDSAASARALYRRLGWQELGRLGADLTVLGLRRERA